MALSKKALEAIRRMATEDKIATEISAAINAGANAQAVSVPVIGTTTNLPTSNVTLSTSDTYTDAAVKTAIDAGVNALRTASESRLDVIEAKIDAVITALKNASLMA